MKNIFLIASLFFSITVLSQQKSAKEFQKETNEHYADAESSPLLEKDLKKFQGLPYFPIDSSFIVTAKLEKTEKIKPFKMKTTTDRTPEYIVYAVAKFKINGEDLQLNIYKSYGTSKPEYEDYLFLPFTDETSGEESYGGGRFIDLRIPKGDEIVIDFNQAYNPYCAYNHNYSCPIPPKENHLPIAINAGVKYTTAD